MGCGSSSRSARWARRPPTRAIKRKHPRMPGAGTTGRGGWLERFAVIIAALVVVLLCLIPPDGLLTENEEDYFQLAARSVAAAPASPLSAVFDSSHHCAVFDHLLGWLIALTGFGGAQILTRVLAVLAYGLALGAVFRRLALDALDAVLVVIIFALLGQAMFGGELLFDGVGAKVAAYVCVLAGLAAVMGGARLARVALLFAVATYFHFLVGLFWFFAAMALRLVGDRRDLRAVMAATGMFLLLVAPLLGTIVWTRLAADSTVAEAGRPSADVIYSIIRAPHHTSPFLNAAGFTAKWLLGYLLAAGMLLGCAVISRLPEAARLGTVARWMSLLLAYLFLALVGAFLDRDIGILGKFYLFRPASLVLLLWLALAVAALGRLGARHWLAVRLIALALLAPGFALAAATRITAGLDARASTEGAQLAAFLARSAAPGSVVLIDPQLEFSFLNFERRTGLPALVLWKFIPTNDPEIQEWYRRLEFRKALFAEGCAGKTAYPVAFLLTMPEHATALAQSCGPIVYASARIALLRRGG